MYKSYLGRRPSTPKIPKIALPDVGGRDDATTTKGRPSRAQQPRIISRQPTVTTNDDDDTFAIRRAASQRRDSRPSIPPPHTTPTTRVEAPRAYHGVQRTDSTYRGASVGHIVAPIPRRDVRDVADLSPPRSSVSPAAKELPRPRTRRESLKTEEPDLPRPRGSTSPPAKELPKPRMRRESLKADASGYASAGDVPSTRPAGPRTHRKESSDTSVSGYASACEVSTRKPPRVHRSVFRETEDAPLKKKPTADTKSKPEHADLTMASLHWQLLCPFPDYPWLRFDVSQPRELIRFTFPHHPSRALTKDELTAPAGSPAPTEMVITSPDLPLWPVNVRRADGIRCCDVFDAIYETFNEVLTRKELGRIPPEYLQNCCAAFKQRCETSPSLTAWEEKQGLRRVDLLQGRKLFFHGIDQQTSRKRWTMRLGARPGPLPF